MSYEEILKKMVDIWRNVFNNPEIDADSDFFLIGGDSLSAATIEALCDEAGLIINLDALYDYRSPRAIVEATTFPDKGKSEPPIEFKDQIPEGHRMTPQQERYWNDYDLFKSSRSWSNVSCTVELEFMESEQICEIVSSMLCRYDSLCAFVNEREDGLWINYDDNLSAHVTINHLTFDGDFDAKEDDNLLRELSGIPLDPFSKPLFRIYLIRDRLGKAKLHWIIHHLIIDGISAGLLAQEIRREMDSSMVSNPIVVGGYKNFAFWMAQYRSGSRWHNDKEFWCQNMREPLPDMRLVGSGHEFTAVRQGRALRTRIRSDIALALNDGLLQRGCTLFALVLACEYRALSYFLGTRDLIIGTPASGRVLPEFHNMIGMLINQIPIRMILDDDLDIWQLAKACSKALNAAMKHQLFQTTDILCSLGMKHPQDRIPFTSFFLSAIELGPESAPPILAGASEIVDLGREVRFDMMTYICHTSCGWFMDRLFCESVIPENIAYQISLEVNKLITTAAGMNTSKN
jgi:acyl carrier protein